MKNLWSFDFEGLNLQTESEWVEMVSFERLAGQQAWGAEVMDRPLG